MTNCTPEPWWADWEGTLWEARSHLEKRQEAARLRKKAKQFRTDSSERRLLLKRANDVQRSANNAAECVRYAARAIEIEARRNRP